MSRGGLSDDYNGGDLFRNAPAIMAFWHDRGLLPYSHKRLSCLVFFTTDQQRLDLFETWVVTIARLQHIQCCQGSRGDRLPSKLTSIYKAQSKH